MKTERKILWPNNAIIAIAMFLSLAVSASARPPWVRYAGAANALVLSLACLSWVWEKWRRAEIELLTSRTAQAARWRKFPEEDPRISLLVGEDDLQCGEVVVVNDNGFIVRPQRHMGYGVKPKPLAPPAGLAWVTGFAGDEANEVDVDA